MALRVIVTRPAAQARGWIERLRARGIDAVALPLLEISAAADTGAMTDAWHSLDRFALAMFVSPNAVTHFFAARPAGAAWPEDLRAAATGPGTVDALVAAGVPRALCVAPVAPPFDSTALWDRLRDEDWSSRAVLVVRGDGGREEFARALAGAGGTVRWVTAYRRSAPQWSDHERSLCEAALAAPDEHLWLLSSGEALGHLVALAPGAQWGASQAIASHARIAEKARALGFGRVTEVPPTLDAVVAVVADHERPQGRFVQSSSP
ncbi:MAG: uroporphyrinogen-III synthase [Aquincola sp.]|nr:uroporphyrinogen-III synthase [Aquincola sp.]MDH4288161.1 uroporphyrinogen-III synthase [Aquincola sp.]MDH5329192.1 uroporphyrinogen-III synthase [Aquincola sp.]